MKEQQENPTSATATPGKRVTPLELLDFAKGVLITVVVLFVLGAATTFFQPNNTIFEACKTILPPIATLVMGYYFGKRSS